MSLEQIVKGGDVAALVADIRKAFGNPQDPQLRKDTVNIASGLLSYDLQAPAKNLYPVNTPIRNKLPRVPGNGDRTTHWVAVTGLTGSGYDAMPYVAEGQRSGVMSLSTSSLNSPYTTLGEEVNLTYEAWAGAKGFEDEKARNAIRLLQKVMLKEENALLGGNFSVALGTPTAPTMTVASTGGTVVAGTYKSAVVALTYEGYRNWLATGALIATGLPTTLTVTSPVGEQMIAKGGSSQKSAVTTAGSAISGTGTIALSTPVVNGAVAYAWFVDDGASGANTLQSVTTLNSVKYLTTPTSTGQNLTAITADNSKNIGGTSSGTPLVTAMDGLLYAAYSSSVNGNTTQYLAGAYVRALATGTAGTGTTLTASGRGTVVEIDDMLQSMWDNYQVSPTALFMNSQQIRDVTTKCLSNNSGPLLQLFADPTKGYQSLLAGGVIEFYFNPFTQSGGVKIPVIIHPFLPAGTIVAWAENLPAQYQSSEVPNVAEVHIRRDYYQIDWPQRTRKFEAGVYAEETLAVYFPPAVGIITNIAAG